MTNEKVTECLNDLLTKAYDAEEGFKKAAERAEEHPGLVGFFQKQSAMRRSFGHDLKQAIVKYGGEPDKGSSIAAKAHQVWISVKDTLTSDHDAEAVLEECVRGEKAALEDYDEKIKCDDLPVDVRALITSQRNSIAESLATAKVQEQVADAK
ncbi:ferritin-like domain-containing protein [Luteolibacter sp. AS25]|uniref:ferritin-like domain-containing protein n=1 Tax=Luteolibacter sp. AS25 TaxID=3135776 RepID=UPI00398ABD21